MLTREKQKDDPLRIPELYTPKAIRKNGAKPALPKIKREGEDSRKTEKSQGSGGGGSGGGTNGAPLGKSRSHSMKVTLDNILNDREGFVEHYFNELKTQGRR